MKNFNLFTYKFARKVIGFIVLGIINYYILAKIDTSLEVFMYLLGNSFGLYFILEFASYGTDEYVEIDFRSEQQQKNDLIKNRKKLVEGSISNLLVEASMGNINEAEVDRRLKVIEKVYSHLNTLELPSGETNFLELPKNTDYV